jgi:hypothetical protein
MTHDTLTEQIAEILEEEFFNECAFDAHNCAKAVLEALKPMIAERERLIEACGGALELMNEPIITPKMFNAVGHKLQAVLALTQSGEGS